MKRFIRYRRPLMFIAVAALPVYPAASIVPFFVLGLYEVMRKRSIPAVAPVLLAALFLGMLGILASALMFVTDTVHSPLENSDVPVAIDVSRDGNLLANTDLSGLRPWSAERGFGAYATYAGSGLWRIVQEDAVRAAEIRTSQEIPIQAGTAYEASVLVRTDTEDFLGYLVFRTRQGWEHADHNFEALEQGWFRLSGVLPEADSPRRLRALHMAGLSDNWNVLELGFAMLRPIPQATTELFRPAFALRPPEYGTLWWFGIIFLLLVVWLPFAYGLRPDSGSLVANGLLAGLSVQLIITLVQTFLLPEVGRQPGTLGHPNILGHSAAVTAFASLALAQRNLPRIVLTLGIAASIAFLSGSDAAVAMLVAGSFMVCIVVIAEQRRPLLALGLGAAGLLVLAIAMAQAWTGLLTDTNNMARLQALRGSWKLIRQYPLTGVGHTNFAHFYEFLDPGSAGPLYRVSHAHSFLAIAVENGLAVFAAAVAAIGIALGQAIRTKCYRAIVVLFVYAGLNLFDYTAFNSAVLLPVWVVCILMGSRGTETSRARMVKL